MRYLAFTKRESEKALAGVPPFGNAIGRLHRDVAMSQSY